MSKDIKEKLKGFIDRQKSSRSIKLSNSDLHLSLNNIGIEEFEGRTAVDTLHRMTLSFEDQILTPEAEKAVIDSIEPLYFSEEDVDITEHELKKFHDIADIHVINGVRSRLRKQQAIVVRCVSNLIIQKQSLCSEEMERISYIQKQINESLGLCNKGRSMLQQGRLKFTSASLGILANYSKRKKVTDVIECLRTLHTLQLTDVRLQALLKDEDYPGAIHLLLECQKAAATYKYFGCISELSSKLNDTLETTEEQLDSAISRVALNCNYSIYENLFIAFGLLNKIQTMMDQLHMHMTSHIHNIAFNIILGYVELYNSNIDINNDDGVNSFSFSKIQYSELCKYVNPECFLACFFDLSKGMWNILRNYKNIHKWHKCHENLIPKDTNDDDDDGNSNNTRKYIEQKFDHGLLRVWQDVQAKVRTFILASDLSNFKLDDFLKVLDVINKLIAVGESFCESSSDTLHDSIRQQSFSFFCNHHMRRLEELHMFLENEGWEICPLKSTFSIGQLIEYKFLALKLSPTSSPRKGNPLEGKDIFELFSEGSPFELMNDDSIEEDIMADDLVENAISDDSDEELPDELKRDFVDELTGEKPQSIVRKRDIHQTPMVTNTTLAIIRLFGKYIQMMRLLEPIAFDVLISLSQLFEYFFYTVFILFTDRNVEGETLSPKLRTTLKRIEDTLILNEELEPQENRTNKVPAPSPCSHILDDSPESLYSLSVRVIAVESLCFLSLQLEKLQSEIESLIPSNKKPFLQQFYLTTVMITTEVRHLVYMYVASRVIDFDGLVKQMTLVKWHINDLMSQHNSYVDVLVRQLQVFSMRLEELRTVHPIPSESVNILWECVMRKTHRALLEGFASARKCSNEGRSLMQLDYQQFLMKLECLTSLRPLPDRHLVETYIKAYYLPENSLEEWISVNKKLYSTQQLFALINCMTHVSKKMKQKVTALLEDTTIVK